ncbi:MULTISPECIES: ABC transporter ATP-binding protein [unclassified Isoptericola]|uniref:ABC transporter ATP-binding protein n=1 Tax=unclassified Isoptericola TaxID=2623355 RepID=UPI002712DC3B|nr:MULTISPECIES: ABC transporter ATP-binding protein [unclassified Isoptericola]MDO8144860.1 ABC transporter ATP-binding protein [Isoptericola sp. 178]MDO8149640.1 ABC transporter ATP-binding protein [Isoptericola sp. b515]MDO8152574.1 ABC transporter ATP-binding protein [Isoptericola sp. b408]
MTAATGRLRPTDARADDATDLDRGTSRAVRRRSLHLLGQLLRPRAGALAGAGALVVISTLAQVSGPLLVQAAIDTALPALREGDPTRLVLVGGIYVLAAVLGGLCAGAYVRAAARVAQSVLLELRRRVFRHTQRLSLEFHESYTSGRVISRQTSDLEALRELFDGGLTGVVSSLMLMVFTAGALFYVDWRSGLVLLAALVPAWLLTRWFQRRSQQSYREQRTASARLIVKFVETMTGMRAVQAFRREATDDAEYGRLGEQYRDANLRIFGVNGRYQPGLVLIGNLTVAAALAYGGWRVVEGSLDVGALVAVLLYVKRFFQPIQQLGMFYNALQSAVAALEKVSGLLAEEPTVVEPSDPTPLPSPRGEIRLQDVTFGYGDGPVVLPRLDLTIPAGQTVALVGSTGAGKSTLAKLVTRFYDASAGRVLLDGVDVRDVSGTDLRRAVVMVTQEAYLFSGSVRENIALGRPDATDAEVEAAARAVGVHEFVTSLPEGYDTDVNKRGGRVSSGQRQLLSFARAFLADPAVLVLDEATSSLDIPGERLVQRGLQTLLADRTAIIIAHRLSTVDIADRVLVLEHGRVLEDGAPADLVAAGGRYAAMQAAWRDSVA